MKILAVDPGNDLAEGITTPLSKVNKISEAAAITKNDSPEIEKLVADDRESSRIRELIILLFEVLFLEDREAQFSETLNVLDVCLQESLEKGNFSQASHILNEISDLKDVVPEQDSDKLLFLDKIINKLKDAAAIQELEQQFFNEKIKNLDSFLEYFQLLCPESIPSIIHLWEKTKDLNVHNRITLLLQKISEKHIETLVEFAKNSHASLVMEIISILGKINTAQTLPFLKTFSANKDMSIRLETIQAIKNIRDKQGDEILLDMLLDKEEQIRIAAVTSLNPSENPAAVNRIIELIAKKDFDKKSRSEKRVVLNYCVQNNSKEVIFLFHSLLKKRTLFLSKNAMATRLSIIATLGTMATPEAVTILKEVSLLRKTRIRKACKFALRKLAARHSQYREITVI